MSDADFGLSQAPLMLWRSRLQFPLVPVRLFLQSMKPGAMPGLKPGTMLGVKPGTMPGAVPGLLPVEIPTFLVQGRCVHHFRRA